ncbi:hypothetical protein SZ64_06715 [Erythrobacter sp. SG61-1L]|nr:hypothetical protein SZ64_06715 [Erythrobacter sp. SG61-1L]
MSAAAFALTGTSAAAADNLDCMSRPFEAGDQEVVDGFVRDFDLVEWSVTGGGEVLADVMNARADMCAIEFGWSDEAGTDAFLWLIGGFLEQGLKANAPISAEEIGRLEASFAAADEARLLRSMGPQIDPDFYGTAEPSDDDLIYLGGLLENSGVAATDENATFTGALLAARLTRIHWARVFAKN